MRGSAGCGQRSDLHGLSSFEADPVGVKSGGSVERGNEGSVSRRRMLKRLAAATTVVWSAPVLSSVHTPPAFAQMSPDGGPPCSREGCVALGEPGSTHCAQQPDCLPGDPSGNPCSCLRTKDDRCGCHSCVFCDNPFVTPCPGGQGECPPGWICAMSCCSDPASVDDFMCHPPCGIGNNPDPCIGLRAAGGRTSMAV